MGPTAGQVGSDNQNHRTRTKGGSKPKKEGMKKWDTGERTLGKITVYATGGNE